MTNDQYLRALLNAQTLADWELQGLRTQRGVIETQLTALSGNPRFYYGGSYAKGTMIRDRYDLDIVVYWPTDCGFTVRGISDAVGTQLRKAYQYVNPKTVAWQIPFQGGFHIDVVPGRAQDATYYYATLYRRDNGSTLQTSLKRHIDTIKDSGRQDVIRLMKLWSHRRGVPMKTFILELMTVEGCKGTAAYDLEQQLARSLVYIRDNITTSRIADPANTNNILSDEISRTDKLAIQLLAKAAVDAISWVPVFA